MNNAELALVFELAIALEQFREHLVLIGGCAHQLFERHEYAQQVAFVPLRTTDADIAIGTNLPPAVQIEAALIQAGFSKDYAGTSDLPVAKYHRATQGISIYAEFLVNLEGSPTDRSGKNKSVMMAGGVPAQRARYISVLLNRTWEVGLTEAGREVRIRIPNPSAFAVQKLLIQDDRRFRRDAFRDLLYIHDTLLMFQGIPEILAEEWEAALRTLPGKTAKNFQRDLKARLLGEDLVEGAVQVAREQQRDLTATSFTEQMTLAMSDIAPLLP